MLSGILQKSIGTFNSISVKQQTTCCHLFYQFALVFKSWLCQTYDFIINISVPVVSSGIFCSVCKRVTGTVRFLIHDKDNEKRVIALAKLMCNKLPSPLNVMVCTIVWSLF